MGFKRMILEQSDDDNLSENRREYIPGRGESFAIGLQAGWKSAIKLLFVIIGLIIIANLVC